MSRDNGLVKPKRLKKQDVFKVVDVKEIGKANGIVIALQLTPMVDKDVYLFVSGF